MITPLQYEYLIAGVAGGMISTLVLHPLDLLKIRIAVDDGHKGLVANYNGSVNALKRIVKLEGYAGLYKGIVPNVVGSSTSWGIYFITYNYIKSCLQSDTKSDPLGPFMHMFAAADAGIFTLFLTNPIWVVKTRLCLQYAEDKNFPEIKKYTGMFDALKKIGNTEGISGLYKGFVPGLFGVSHGAIQFMLYEEMKINYNVYKDELANTKLDSIEYITFAAISKIVAATITYPYQVIRARLQDQHHNYKGMIHCIKSIWRYESWFGYYKGLTVNLIRVTPATIITFVVYENLSNHLLNK